MSRSGPPVASPSRTKRLLFALVPSLVFLLLLEGAARVRERIVAEHDSSTSVLADLRRRDAAGELRRREGETLVYVYGESTVYGSPIPEIGLVAQMQHYAARRSPGRAVRVVNLGIPGTDSSQLRGFVQETIGNRPDLAIVLCGHNEFVRAPGDEPIDGPLRHCAIARLTVGLFARAALSLESRDAPPGLDVPVVRASDAFRRREERYRTNMTAIARMARDEHVPVLLTTLASNLRDWPPVFRRLAPLDGDRPRQDSYQQAMEEGLGYDDRGDVVKLRAFVKSWESRSPDDPMVRYLRGRVRLADGDAAGALDDFRFARDFDPIPLRMSTRFIDDVRTIARAEGALLADFDADTSPAAIPGAELFVDNCHPSPEGAQRMAAALLRTAEGAGLLPHPQIDAFALDEFCRDVGYGPGSSLRLRFLVCNGQYSMRRPIYAFPIAARYLTQAVAEFPSAWVAHANLATLLLIRGDVEDGRRALRRAEELRGRPLDLDDQEALPFLKEAMTVRGLR